MIRECIHCKKSRGGGSDVWCSEGHPYTSYMRETECPYFEINRAVNKMKLKVGDNMSDGYTVINKEEPRGQSVVENGIPCTARSCVTQLNGLSQENKELRTKEIILKNKLNDLYEAIGEHYTETVEKNDDTVIIRAETELKLITKILEEVKKI